MNRMQKILRPYLSLVVIAAGFYWPLNVRAEDANATNAASKESSAARDARMAWWRNARFGMFIHWGLYSQAAGYWEGKPTGGAGEWIMTDMKIPREQYAKLAAQFDPVKFNADQWVQTAKAAGMKYLVITSKHHDGFCLFDTKATTYNVVDATPWHKDPLLELSRACRRHGVKFCVYHSIMDWHSPYQVPGQPDPEHPVYNPTSFARGQKEAYVEYLKSELKELITRYHPALLWFDGQWMNGWTDEDGRALYQYLHGLDPALIINDRVKGAGDYETPEQYIPPNGLPGHDWETCMTMNNTWGYKRDDHDWKSTETLIRNIVDIASKGGNYLLNVGPTAEGLIPGASVERLKEIGSWMKVNGEAIYGTTASPFARQLPWGRCTRKTAGNKTTLYLHVFNWPADGRLVLPGLQNKISAAYLLAGRQKLAAQNGEEGLTISLPAAAPDKVSSTVVLKFKGAPEIDDFKLSTEPREAFTLVRKPEQSLTINIESTGRFDRRVELSVSGFPDGMSATFNPPSIPGSGAATLTLAGADHAASGIYALTIVARSGRLQSSAPLTLTLPNAAGNNVAAIFHRGHAVLVGGFDMANYAYDAAALGNSATFGGTVMKLGPVDQMDAWSATKVPLTGQGSVLKILAAAANGNQMRQRFTVRYIDGTTQSFMQDLSDWCEPQGYKGETKAISMADRLESKGNVASPGTYLYGYSFPLDSSKTVQSLILPDNRNVIVLAVCVKDSVIQH